MLSRFRREMGKEVDEDMEEETDDADEDMRSSLAARLRGHWHRVHKIRLVHNGTLCLSLARRAPIRLHLAMRARCWLRQRGITGREKRV